MPPGEKGEAGSEATFCSNFLAFQPLVFGGVCLIYPHQQTGIAPARQQGSQKRKYIVSQKPFKHQFSGSILLSIQCFVAMYSSLLPMFQPKMLQKQRAFCIYQTALGPLSRMDTFFLSSLEGCQRDLSTWPLQITITLSVKGKNCKLFEDLRRRPMLDAYFSHRISHLQQIHQESLGFFFGTLALFTFMKHAPKNCGDFRA